MKKIILILSLSFLSFSNNIRQYDDVYKLELVSDKSKNKVKEIVYIGNEFHTSLSLKNTINSLKKGDNMSDENVLSTKNLFLSSLNPSKKIKINFQRIKDDYLRAYIESESTYKRKFTLSLDNNVLTPFYENIFTTNMDYSSFNIGGKDRIFNISYTFYPLNITKYSNVNTYFKFVDYERGEFTTFKTSFKYSKPLYKENNVYIQAKFESNWDKYLIYGKQNLSLGINTKYIFTHKSNEKYYYYSHYLGIPVILKYEYLKNNFKLNTDIGLELGLKAYPKLQANAILRLNNEINYYNDKFFFNSKFKLFNSFVKFDDYYFQNITEDFNIRANKDKNYSDFMATYMNTVGYNNKDRLKIYMFNDLKLNIDFNKEKKTYSTLGIGLLSKNKDFYEFESNLGISLEQKPKMGVDLKLNINIR